MTDIFFTDSGGYRILMKNSNLFSDSFSTDFMFKYLPDTSPTPTFPGDNTRIILFSMGGGSTTSSKGVTILLEKYGGNEYITAIYNSNNTPGWGQYLPGLVNEDGINGIKISSDNFYLVTFNLFAGNNQNPSTYELNVIEGPKFNPQPSDILTRSGSTSGYINYSPQAGFGTPNENVGPTQTTFPTFDYTIGLDTITAYSARNISINFIRLWDGNVNQNSINYNPISLFNLDISNSLIDVKADNYPSNPTNPYPRNVGFNEPTDKLSDDYQGLVFQLSAKNVSTLGDLRNTAYFQDGTNVNGVPPTLTNSPTGYSPLEDYAVNNTAGTVLLQNESNIGGDPHILPFIKPNYFIFDEGKFLLFSYEDNNNYTKVYTITRQLGKTKKTCFNDKAIIMEKKDDIEYKFELDFNTFKIENMRDNMEISTSKIFSINGKRKIVNNLKTFIVTCLNKNFKFTFYDLDRTITLRLDLSLIPYCKGGLISEKLLEKVE